MTLSEIRATARAQLGGSPLHNIWLRALLICLFIAIITGAAAAIPTGLLTLIIMGPLNYGLCFLFLKQHRSHRPMYMGDLFNGFTDDFGQTFLIGLLSGIFVFLWSLLLLVPGLVKSYAYSQKYYIKADHADYDWRQCLTASEELMEGHKGQLFLLDLSFLGWYLLGALLLGIGIFWVMPYHQAARAIFYNELILSRREAEADARDDPADDFRDDSADDDW
jgi:uncharacterized membrane protein